MSTAGDSPRDARQVLIIPYVPVVTFRWRGQEQEYVKTE